MPDNTELIKMADALTAWLNEQADHVQFDLDSYDWDLGRSLVLLKEALCRGEKTEDTPGRKALDFDRSAKILDIYKHMRAMHALLVELYPKEVPRQTDPAFGCWTTGRALLRLFEEYKVKAAEHERVFYLENSEHYALGFDPSPES